jgi:hypothetical protein
MTNTNDAMIQAVEAGRTMDETVTDINTLLEMS